MSIKTVLSAAAVALTMALAATPSQAAPAVPQLDAGKLAQTIADWDGPSHHHRWRHRHIDRRFNYCRNWRHECAARWGWGGWRYQRCLARHGC